MLPCSLLDLALYFSQIRPWFPARIREVEDFAGFPGVFERVPDVHWLIAAEGSFVRACFRVVEGSVLCLFT